MTITDILQQAKTLSLHERKELVKRLIDSLDDHDTPDRIHSILELAGLGAELWEGIDPQEYVHQLRSEWDHRQ